MTYRPDNAVTDTTRNRTTIALVVVALIVVLLAGVWILQSRISVTSTTAANRAEIDWLKQKAKESGGDFTRLSAADQQHLRSLHGKMAEAVLKGNAHPVNADY